VQPHQPLVGFVGAVALRREIEGEWVLFLAGVLSVVLGVAMAVLPGVGLLSLVWLVGLYALAIGVALPGAESLENEPRALQSGL
jgi:uncharacterized membrane protein HdeD (DUF308 family)